MERPTNDELILEAHQVYYVLQGALNDARTLSDHIARGTGGRETSLAITAIQEAGHWLKDAAKELTSKESTTEKTITIIVNGQDVLTTQDQIPYEEVVKLSYHYISSDRLRHTIITDSGIHTITYRHGPQENLEGSLLPGQSVKITDGMVFSVAVTGNA